MGSTIAWLGEGGAAVFDGLMIEHPPAFKPIGPLSWQGSGEGTGLVALEAEMWTMGRSLAHGACEGFHALNSSRPGYRCIYIFTPNPNQPPRLRSAP